MADNANPVDKTDVDLDSEDVLDQEWDKDTEEGSLSDEEKEQLRALLEADEAKVLAEAGYPQFKSFREAFEGYKSLNDQDKLAFPIIKEVAAIYNMTPHEFAQALRGKVKGTAGGKPGGSGTPAKDPIKEMQAIAEQVEFKNKLQNRFSRFQARMEKEEAEIPDGMFDELSNLLPALFVGKSKEQIEKMDWYGTAYKLYLFNLSETPDADNVRKKLSAHDAKRLLKLKQLGVPRGGGGKGKGTSEDAKTWGGGIDALPEPKK